MAQSRVKSAHLGQLPIFCDGKYIQTSTSIRGAGIKKPSRRIQDNAPSWIETIMLDECDLCKRPSDWILFVGCDCRIVAAEPLVVRGTVPRYKNKSGIAYYAGGSR